MVLIVMLLIFGTFGTMVQYVWVLMEFLEADEDNTFINSKEDLLIWLIPTYMPIKAFFSIFIKKWEELK